MELFDRIRFSRNILLLLVGATIVLIFFAGFFLSTSSQPSPQAVAAGKIKDITLDNGTIKLRVQRNGVVEITTPDRVFFQYWDEDRVNRLFRLLEEIDFSDLSSRLKPGETGYLLTLNTDQGLITIAIPISSNFIPEAVQELIQIVEDITQQLPTSYTFTSPTPTLTPLSNPINSPLPSPLASPSPQVTPTPSSSPSPSPSLVPSAGPPSTQQLFVCEFTGSTPKTRVVSETLCDLVE